MSADLTGSVPWFNDKLLEPIRSTVPQLEQVIDEVLRFAATERGIDPDVWNAAVIVQHQQSSKPPLRSRRVTLLTTSLATKPKNRISVRQFDREHHQAIFSSQ
jgi:hypothetical protein